MKSGKPDYGFTLVELILVVLLMTVIAGLTIPNFSRSFESIKLKQTAKDIVYIMRYAQSRAVTKNIKVRLDFESEYSQYQLKEEVRPGDYAEFTGRAGRIFNVPATNEVSADQDNILFYPDGQMDKLHVYVCRKEKCFTVSTKEQRGHVLLYKDKIEG